MPSHISPRERLHGITVLLIDDDKEDRRHWSNALRNSPDHFRVLEADSGESGLNLFREQAVDCVILDLDMPESGLFTLLRLVPDWERPQIAVVVLTKLTQAPLLKLVKKYGAYACLIKHLCSIEELTRTVQQAMASVKSITDLGGDL